MKIGIFGGTFDPIHSGHLAIAEEVLKTIGLDRVLLIPAGRPPHKKGRKVLPAQHRIEMVRLAVEGHPGLEVSDLEITRRGKSYTIETVKALERNYPKETEFYLILGLDAFLEFSSWRASDELMARCHIVVVSRPGYRFSDLSRLDFLGRMDPEWLDELDAGRRFRRDLPLSAGTRLILIRVPAHDVSATQIRDHLSGGKRLKNLLPPLVESYIIKHKIYSRATSSS
ncbi:MAG: nicotinate-nucleotide adenylyltransferase [Nitrospirae bacterium]|nr:nicotinate-nucleotide adenylyltransferase [Nitrospirota bacterium]